MYYPEWFFTEEDPVLSIIRQELKKYADPHIEASSKRFFREETRCYGIRTATVTTVARKYWKEVRDRDRQEIFSLIEDLYSSGMLEEAFIAAHWAEALSDRFEQGDLAVLRGWVGRFITNWAACDGLCNHAAGNYFMKYPSAVGELLEWTVSENRWMRRAAAVSLIIPAKRGNFAETAFAIADRLLVDRDDLVQKGYGWLLKEVSRKHPDRVFSYVMEHRRVMPRTALRYAIELMPGDLRAMAMKKDG